MKVFIVTLILAFGYIVAGLSGSGSRSAVPQCPASGSPLTPSALEVAAACSAADLDYPIIRDVADSDCAMSGYGTANETCVVGLLKQRIEYYPFGAMRYCALCSPSVFRKGNEENFSDTAGMAICLNDICAYSSTTGSGSGSGY